MTLIQHELFMKVVDENGAEIARCDKLADGESSAWRLSYFLGNRWIQKPVDSASDAERLVVAAAMSLRAIKAVV